MKKIKAINNLLILYPVVGIKYLQYFFSRTSKRVKFADFLIDKQKVSYNKHIFFWLYLKAKNQYDINRLLHLWEVSKSDIEFKANNLKLYATFFESAISNRNKKIANEILGYINQEQNNYHNLAKSLITVFIDRDANQLENNLGDLPYPMYLFYLHPMLFGIVNETKGNFSEAIENYNLAAKKIPTDELSQSNWIQSRIADMENQKVTKKIREKMAIGKQ